MSGDPGSEAGGSDPDVTGPRRSGDEAINQADARAAESGSRERNVPTLSLIHISEPTRPY